ncbi:hypothetical protein MYA_0871 [Burkholderia sp. KJ006]|nr:hypothetical protein MYA_0871 [Burkholderia sp. KJ006]
MWGSRAGGDAGRLKRAPRGAICPRGPRSDQMNACPKPVRQPTTDAATNVASQYRSRDEDGARRVFACADAGR